MRRYTTPTLPITVPRDITQADVYVDLKQGQRKSVEHAMRTYYGID